jgi:murein DD-endopeptidase MepM/ murein hydrolase activator NlpD
MSAIFGTRRTGTATPPPIYAPGDGKVVAVENRYPDNEYEGPNLKHPILHAGADEDLGNFVIIDHGDGESSVMPHMLAGSVAVKQGDRVRHGQQVGRVGFSGDAIFPHVHYSLLRCGDLSGCEGLLRTSGTLTDSSAQSMSETITRHSTRGTSWRTTAAVVVFSEQRRFECRHFNYPNARKDIRCWDHRLICDYLDSQPKPFGLQSVIPRSPP